MVRTQNKSLIPEIEYDSPRSWIRLILLFIVGVVGTVGMWSVVVVMPALETEFGIDRGKASLLYATTMVGFGLGNFLIGKVIAILLILYSFIVIGHSLKGGLLTQSLVVIHLIGLSYWLGSLLPLQKMCNLNDFVELKKIAHNKTFKFV